MHPQAQMTLIPVYASTIETFSVYLAPIFFAFFLLAIIIRKTASQEDAYTQSNRVHFRVGTLYATTLIGIAIYLHEMNANFLTGILTGLYIYFSLHYVFIFPLIGICKKSISVNIMECIYHIEQTGSPCSKKTLSNQMEHRNTSIDDIRSSRLGQMVLLKFATTKHNRYRITPFGKKVHGFGEIILNILNQKRL
jgi:hypothetical protein